MITPSFSVTATERVLPRLALDFTAAALDARVTFTRSGATATRVNASGLVETIAADIARFDFDPITLVCKGLLIEEARTNVMLQSEDFSGWTTTNATINTNVVTAPDGNTTADKLIGNLSVSNVNHLIAYSYTTSVVEYTFSVFVKAAERNWILLNDTLSGAQCFFDTSAGTVGTATSCTGAIADFGNGWYRCSISFTGVAGSSLERIFVARTGSATAWIGNDVDGVYIWGAQLEVGEFPTSYIPTTTTALTRNADVATMTGTDFSDWYSAGSGGLAALVLPSTVLGTRPAIQFDDNTADEVIALRGDTTNPELVIVEGGAGQAQIDAGTIAANTAYNLGAAWATNDCAAAVNGNAAVTDTTATIPAVTQARLGSDGTNYLNGHLQSIRYWPQRIIDAEVRAFSK
jgi:hypothetical protein